jgi:hypothetical protein
VEDVRIKGDPTGVAFDLDLLERRLREAKDREQGAVVVAAYGEVNTVCPSRLISGT